MQGFLSFSALPCLCAEISGFSQISLKSAEYNFDWGDPQSFLTYIKEITNHKARSAR